MFSVVISDAAQADLRHNVEWWGEHRSVTEAETWYCSILEKIYSLEHMPKRCTLAYESKLLKREIYHLFFGTSSKHTHRVLFTIDDSRVSILRVLSTRQAVIDDSRDLG